MKIDLQLSNLFLTESRKMLLNASSCCPPTANLMKTLLVVTAILATFCEAGLLRCPEGHFLNPNVPYTCMPCATCPKNQIIRVPCSQNFDTVCGPFSEFYKFLQAPHVYPGEGDEGKFVTDQSHRILVHASDDGPSGRKPTAGFQDQDRAGEDFEDLESSSVQMGEAEAPTLQAASSKPGQQKQEMPSLPAPGEVESQWRVLALALIIILCVVCIVLILLIFFIIYTRASRPRVKSALLDSANGSSTRNEQNLLPQLRYFLFPICRQVQITASGPRERMLTEGTPSGHVQDGAADRDQMQATSSAEYVYFKRP